LKIGIGVFVAEVLSRNRPVTVPSISQKLAQFFCTLRYEDLADILVYEIKAFFLDAKI